MTITNGLATIDDFVDYMAATFGTIRRVDADMCIEAASRVIEQWCAREFRSTTEARYFDSPDGVTVHTGDLQSVSALATDTADDGTYATTISASNYQLLPVGGRSPYFGSRPYNAIRLLNATTFPTCNDRAGAIKITGTWGWSAVPTEIKRACLILAQDMYRDKDSDLPSALTLTESGIVSAKMPRRVIDLCRPYQIVRWVA